MTQADQRCGVVASRLQIDEYSSFMMKNCNRDHICLENINIFLSFSIKFCFLSTFHNKFFFVLKYERCTASYSFMGFSFFFYYPLVYYCFLGFSTVISAIICFSCHLLYISLLNSVVCITFLVHYDLHVFGKFPFSCILLVF